MSGAMPIRAELPMAVLYAVPMPRHVWTIPAGVSALAALLRAIDDEQLHLDPCRSMFAP
jgi:hypothetical protein